MSLLGAGVAPAGLSPAGIGAPADVSEVRPKLLQKPDGSQGNVALIQDGDYVLDARGREIGADSTSIKVLLALTTAKNTTAVRDFGIELNLNIFSPDTTARVDAAVRAALADCVKLGLISIMSITFTRKDQAGSVSTKWVDLKTAQLAETSIDVG